MYGGTDRLNFFFFLRTLELVCPEALLLLWFKRSLSPFLPNETEKKSPDLHVRFPSFFTFHHFRSVHGFVSLDSGIHYNNNCHKLGLFSPFLCFLDLYCFSSLSTGLFKFHKVHCQCISSSFRLGFPIFHVFKSAETSTLCTTADIGGTSFLLDSLFVLLCASQKVDKLLFYNKD